MRRLLIPFASAILTAATLVAGATGTSAMAQNQLPLTQLPISHLRTLVLTTDQAIAATGFAGSLTPGPSNGFKCGRQQGTSATYCSRIWDSTTPAAHPSIVTAASFASARAARAHIRAEGARIPEIGTVVSQTPTRLVYFITGLPDFGTAAIAQQALGSTYAYAWCSSSADLPTEPTVECAERLLAAQVERIRSR